MPFQLLPAEGALLQQISLAHCHLVHQTLRVDPGTVLAQRASKTQLEQDCCEVLRHWYQQLSLELLDQEQGRC